MRVILIDLLISEMTLVDPSTSSERLEDRESCCLCSAARAATCGIRTLPIGSVAIQVMGPPWSLNVLRHLPVSKLHDLAVKSDEPVIRMSLLPSQS